MSYKFDGIDISGFGVTPILTDSEDLALSGIFDLPKRTGNTEYNWGTGIEPFVSREDIALDGRKIELSVALSGEDYKNRLSAFKSACINLRKLSTEFGEFDVIVKDEVNVVEYPGEFAVFSIPMWQQNFVLPELCIAGSQGKGILLDNFNLMLDFGIILSEKKNNHSIGKRIDISTTEPCQQTQYRDNTDIVLSCFMKGNSFAELHSNIMQFYALCMSPDVRTLRISDDSKHTVYFKDGVTAKANHGNILTFDLKMRVI